MKRILTILGVIAAIVLVAIFSLRSWTKSGSPEAIAQIDQNGLKISVDYCQPSKKGRKIFGGLVPYGEVWRTGANEATLLKVNQDVTVAGQSLKAGEYTLWTIPAEGNWTAIINKETGQWGTNYDQTKDVLRVPITAHKHTPTTEQFLISFTPTPNGADMRLVWEDTEAIIPIKRQ